LLMNHYGVGCSLSAQSPFGHDLSREIFGSFKPYLRRALDGQAYTHAEFQQWYRDYYPTFNYWWEKAPPVNAPGDALACVLLKSRAGVTHADSKMLKLPTIERLPHLQGVEDEVHCHEGDFRNPEEMVIDVIEHDEPAAVVSLQEAYLVSTVRWASHVQHSIGATLLEEAGSDDMSTPVQSDPIYLLHFNRNPTEMMNALYTGLPFRQSREMLLQEGFQWILPCGACMFVHPHQYCATIQKLNRMNLNLGHSDIVISACLEYLLEESVQDIGKGAWAKSRIMLLEDVCKAGVSANISGTSNCTDFDLVGDHLVVLSYKRTFIQTERLLLHASSVIQSSTANERVIMNPRRILRE